ncbi:response regulator [Accumulibacter sp.]|uniref:response regulator n=1 Tax=Accumulibacter sp. TaxID=2053492 RepID=UPI0028C464A4|nr:response regulator [Accumulibacter sp.]
MKSLTAYLERLTVSGRLLALAAVAVVAVLAVGVSIFPRLQKLAQVNEHSYQASHTTVAALQDLRYEWLSMQLLLRDLIREQNPQQRDALDAALLRSDAQFLAGVSRLRMSYAGDPQEVAQVETLYRAYAATRAATLDQLRSGAAEVAWQRTVDATAGNAGPLLTGRLDQLGEAASAQALKMNAQAAELYRSERQQAMAVIAACLALLLFAALVLARSITLPLRRLRDSIADLSAGRFKQSIPCQDQKNEIGEIGRGVALLQNVYQGMAAQRWIRGNIAAISGDLQQAASFTELAQKLISALAPLLGADHGAFFLVTKKGQTLKMIASYRIDYPQKRAVIRLGEGLVGQCASDRQLRVVSDSPEGDVGLAAEAGEVPAKTILLAPVTRSERVLAVIELTAARAFTGDERAVLDGLLPLVAMSLEIIERNTRTQRLLEATQAQATQLERQAAELAALEEHSRLILSSVNDGILGVDVDGRLTFANPAVLRFLGYTAGELLRQPFHELVHYAYPDGRDFPYCCCPMFLTLQDGQARQVDDEVLWRKDGTPLAVEYATTPFRKADALVGAVIVFRDITARRADEARLRQAHEEQSAIFETASLGIAFIKERIFVNANRRLGELLACSSEELINQPTTVCVPDGAYPVAAGGFDSELMRGDILMRVIELQRKDGSYFWCRISGRAVDAGDLSHGTVWMFEDVTNEREAAEAMQRSKELAEETTRMKTSFLANMSHEIRTPMNAIIGMSHLLLKTELTPRQRDYMKKIQDSGQHLLGIVNDILDFSKVEAGKLVIEHSEFALEEVLDNVVNLMAGKASAKGLELVIDIDPAVPPRLIGDALRLRQVLINYTNNAVKFTPAGEVDIRVGVRDCDGDDLMLHFAVRDTGIGLTEVQMSRLFQSFVQADTSTTRRFGGTGLGLAISKRLAELMGGEVGVSSEYGKGSTFWFTARLGRAAHAPRGLLPSPDLRGRRVLVVDDNQTARIVIRDLLRSMSFVVTDLPSGEAAIEAVRAAAATDPYQIVFLDWQMPGLNGLQAASRIVALGLSPNPQLVIISTDRSEELLERAAAAGVSEVLLKPVHASLLLDTAIRLIGGAQRQSPPQAVAPALVDRSLLAITGARVLLVEDNELNREVASELLASAGLVVDQAEDGQVAVDKVAAGSYDMVLMDVQMPVLDGIAATLAIRQLADRAHLPIVAMTANAMPADQRRCLEAGMVDFLAKPIEPDQLWRILLKWIKPQAAPEPAEQALPDLRGVNVTTGLRRVLGKKPLYLSLLRKFVTGQRTTAEQLAAALQAGDWIAAERLAHDLKGVAANIGASDLRTGAGRLESAIRQRKTRLEVDARLGAAATLLDALIAELATKLPPEAVTETATRVDRARLQQVCVDLAALLAESDSEAGDLLDGEGELLRAAFGARYPSIDSAVRSFDYETGLIALREAASLAGITL